MTAQRRVEELDPRWRAHAACKGRSELFLPDAAEPAIDRSFREARAKAVCRQCPVIVECRDWARTYREPFVAGGESAEDRHRAGFRPVAPGVHVERDMDRATRAQVAKQLAGLPLEQLAEIAALARALEPEQPGDPR